MKRPPSPEQQELEKERDSALEQLTEWLEIPMLVLGFVWLVLLVIELVWGLTPFFSLMVTAIWIIFIVDFVVEFALAPKKARYLTNNWLVALSLMLPPLRIFRALRALRLMKLARVSRGMRLLRFITSLNRGMRALRTTMRKRRFGYVLALTVIVTLAGAAGIYSFEKDAPADSPYALKSYGAALWWTAMVMTTMGSQYWPLTPEGRILCLILALYAFTVFGYVTAMLATLFIGLDTGRSDELSADTGTIDELRREIAELRRALDREREQRRGSV